MARYEHADISFDYPRDWQDRSIVAFAARSKDGATTNIVMTRDERACGEDLRHYADRQLFEMAQRLDAFELVSRAEISVDGVTAVEVRFHWWSTSGHLAQRLVILPGKGQLILTVTCTSDNEGERELKATFDRVIASVRLPRNA
jgi:hypothetical protein